MFKILVIEYKVVSLEYFLDKMTMWEVDEVIENLAFYERGEWERYRLLMYIIAQVNSTKKIKMNDLLKFEWDEDLNETNITNDDIARLRAQAHKFAQEKI